MPKQLIPTSVSAPAFFGLNTQRKSDILDFRWATKAENCSIDDAGRIASRKGSQRQHATAITSSPAIKSSFEYIDASGSTLQIVAAGNAIYKLVSGSLTDISGTITTPTADNWKFQNFNGKCVGFQTGHAPIVLSTIAGNFADITIASGSASSNEVLSAFGRLWILDGVSLKYCASLDETHWTTGAGSFDLSSVWLSGMDIPVGLAEFNGHLVVFGKQSIIVYENPWTPTGTGAIDATTMNLVENLGGIGCIARDSVQHIGSDILFLSQQGVRSLGRTIQEKSMPIHNISKNVNDEINQLVASESLDDIKSGYSSSEGFYIISLPTADKTFYFDLRFPLRDNSYRATTWNISYTSINSSSSDDMYFGTAGYINKHTGYLDDVLSDGSGGSTYNLTYESGWNDMSTESQNVSSYIKIPKKISVMILGGAAQTLTIKWAYDFVDDFTSVNKTLSASSTIAEFNVAEFNIAEFGGGSTYKRINSTMHKSGQFIKFGISIIVNNSEVALQQIDMQTKLGRLAN